LAFSVLSAHGQPAKVALRGAAELGSSAAARELLAEEKQQRRIPLALPTLLRV